MGYNQRSYPRLAQPWQNGTCTYLLVPSLILFSLFHFNKIMIFESNKKYQKYLGWDAVLKLKANNNNNNNNVEALAWSCNFKTAIMSF